MPRVVRAFPLLPGKHRALAAFLDELTERKAENDRFYRAHGVTRESAHLQSTPLGEMVIVCTDVDDPTEAAAAYAARTTPFEAWFKAKILELSGVDPNLQPLGPPSRCLFDWQEVEVAEPAGVKVL
jgi:hypothetical protein